MNIRRLEQTEASGVKVGMFLLESFAKEHRFGTIATEPNVQRAWEHIWAVLDQGVAWIIESDAGDVLGSIAVMPEQLWWSDQTYYSDGWFYVAPAARATPAHIMLLEAAEGHVKEMGYPFVLEVFNAIKPGLVGKLLHRRGYADLGGTYIKEL